MVEIRRYSSADKALWDNFVKASRNGTFLFQRDYMDYHADRFADHSLLFFDNRQRLMALLPANIVTNTDASPVVYSHQGLTYGGLVVAPTTTIDTQKQCLDATKALLAASGIAALVYRPMPSCYHLLPSEDDDYLLWQMGATMSRCMISSATLLQDTDIDTAIQHQRRTGMRHALAMGYVVEETTTPDTFWPIMEANMRERYNATPVHSLQEMKLLMARFPENIRCFLVGRNGEPQGGAIVYETQQTAHLQYAHSTQQGKADRAIDMLYHTLLYIYKEKGFRFFDFGTSCEQGGHALNSSLIAQKESFGGRGITYKEWTLNI